MGVLLGAIADDFTGATDLCNTLVRRGMRTVQLIDVPQSVTEIPDAEAVVVALKSRAIPPAEAIGKSLAALGWLRQAGARQILFKYCSTFDSTDAGNIGPVAEALMAALGTDFTLFCPAFPEAGRTIYKGYLFVGDVLLSESGMRDHPLTPMRDPSLVRVLQRQSRGKVGLVPHYEVARGASAIADAFGSLRVAGFQHAIVDAIEDHDLDAIGEAAADFKLITGGSGIALGLPANFRRQGLLGDGAAADALPIDRRGNGGAVRVVLDRDPDTGFVFPPTPAGFYDRPGRRGGGTQHCRGSARLGGAKAGERTGSDQRNGPARRGGRDSEGARSRARWGSGRGASRRHSPRPGRARRAATSGRRWRDRGGGGAGAGCHRPAHRPPDRSRGAVDGKSADEPRRACFGIGAQIRQFRGSRFFPASLFHAVRRPMMMRLFECHCEPTGPATGWPGARLRPAILVRSCVRYVGVADWPSSPRNDEPARRRRIAL